ncbi:MAG: DUF2726 domain-containing protein [Pacificimonas sp.]|jgi:hypothetical protein|nr:DUF2726 domain-containing protein [Pacificimonas sp.]
MTGDLSTMIAIAVGVMIFGTFSSVIFPKRKRLRTVPRLNGRSRTVTGERKPGRDHNPVNRTSGGKRSATEQLEKVMQSQFASQPLLSKREARVAAEAEAVLAEIAPGWRVCPQVALGEAVQSPCKSAYLAVNAKRCDLIVVDENWRPVAALEYQGSGHYQKDAAARDAVKREALRRAGIGWIEVLAGDKPQDLRAAITTQVRRCEERLAA